MDVLHSMRVFCRVAEMGQFASAARDMALSPAAVTRLIAGLESHLNARLISRTTRRFALTEVGEVYLERARFILNQVGEAEALVARESHELRGHLRLLAPAAFTVHQIAGLLPRFHERYPGVTVETTACGPLDSVDENFDICILTAGRKPIDGDFVAHRLACSDVVLCASPGYLAKQGRPAQPVDLATHELMLPSHLRELTFRRGDEAPIEWHSKRPAISAGDSNTMFSGALHGLGIAALPSFVASDALRSGALERVLCDWRLMRFTLYAAMPTRRHVPARTRAMIDFLVEAFGGAEDDPWLSSRA